MADVGRLRADLEAFRQRLGVPAVGTGLLAGDGTTTIEVVGDRKRDGPVPVSVDDQWHIGSCAKAITAVLYARLVERGDAQWGVAVTALFPDLSGQIDIGWSVSTIDEVLVSRSGMKANLSPLSMLRAWKDPSPPTEQRTGATLTALSTPPRRRGTFRYSNLGYVVAGAAIDRLSGMPFEDAVRTHVFEPLGITSAGFGPPPDVWGHRSRLQIGGLVIGRGSPADPGDRRSDNPAVLNPAGRIHLKLADWAKFQQVFLTGHGAAFLERTSVAHLLAVPSGRGTGMAMGWAPAGRIPEASYGMQGSNTRWAATALIDADRRKIAMVAVNDGRTRVLAASAQLARSILRLG